jgi:hypothetical protein
VQLPNAWIHSRIVTARASIDRPEAHYAPIFKTGQSMGQSRTKRRMAAAYREDSLMVLGDQEA